MVRRAGRSIAQGLQSASANTATPSAWEPQLPPDDALLNAFIEDFVALIDQVAVRRAKSLTEAVCRTATSAARWAEAASERLWRATTPSERWAASLARWRRLVIAIKLAHLYTSILVAGAESRKTPLERRILKCLQWSLDKLNSLDKYYSELLAEQGTICSAALAARGIGRASGDEAIEALNKAVKLCRPHPGRRRDARTRAARLDLASIMAVATQAVEDMWPEHAKLRRQLAEAFTRELEKATILRPRSKERRRILDALPLEDGHGKPYESRSMQSVGDVAELVAELEALERVRELQVESAKEGRASVAALEYLATDTDSREAVAGRHRVTVAQLRAAEQRLNRRIDRLRRSAS